MGVLQDFGSGAFLVNTGSIIPWSLASPLKTIRHRCRLFPFTAEDPLIVPPVNALDPPLEE